MKTHILASKLQLFIVVVLIVSIAGAGVLFLSGVTFASSPPPTTARLAAGQEQAGGMPQRITGPSQISRDPTLSFAVGQVDILPGTMAEVPILITTNQNTVTHIAFTLKYAEYLVFEGNISDEKFLAGTTHHYTHDPANRAISFVISGTIQAPAVVVSIPLVAREKDNVPEDVADQDVRLEQILLTTDSQVDPIAGPPKTVPYIIQTRLDVHVNGSNDDVLIEPEKIILGETSVLTMPLGWRGYDTIKWDIYGNDDPDGIFYTDEPICEACLYRKTSTETELFHPLVYVLNDEGSIILSGTLKTGVHVYVPPLTIGSDGPSFLGQETAFSIQMDEEAPAFEAIVEEVQWVFDDGNTATTTALETTHLYRTARADYQPTATLTVKEDYQWDAGTIAINQPLEVRPPILELTNSTITEQAPTDPNRSPPEDTTTFTVTVEGLYLTDGILEFDFGDGSAIELITLPSDANGKVQTISLEHRYTEVGEYQSQVRMTSAAFGGDDPIVETSSLATVAYRPLSLQMEVDDKMFSANGRGGTSVQVTVRNSNDQLMEGVSVGFSADPSRGEFSPSQTATTDENGVAEVMFVPERIIEWGDTLSIVVTIEATVEQMGASLVEQTEVTLLPFIELFIPNVIVQNRYAPD